MARRTKRKRKTKTGRKKATKIQAPHVPTGYDASWDLGSSIDVFERKCKEWDDRNWESWLDEHLTFPFEVIRKEDMDDDRYFFGAAERPELFAVGSKMTVLGLRDGDYDPDCDGVYVDVQQPMPPGAQPIVPTLEASSGVGRLFTRLLSRLARQGKSQNEPLSSAVQHCQCRGAVPLQDLEVRPKNNPNYWPVREFVVWYANR